MQCCHMLYRGYAIRNLRIASFKGDPPPCFVTLLPIYPCIPWSSLPSLLQISLSAHAFACSRAGRAPVLPSSQAERSNSCFVSDIATDESLRDLSRVSCIPVSVHTPHCQNHPNSKVVGETYVCADVASIRSVLPRQTLQKHVLNTTVD